MKIHPGQIIAPLVFALALAWGLWAILQTPPPAKRATETTAPPLVTVTSAEPAEHSIRIYAYGRVEATNPLDIRPQVEGRIIRLHPSFEAGGLIPTGEVLVKIEEADYQLALDAARSTLDKAQARLAIEGGKRRVAKEELRLLSDSMALDKDSRSLALRTPQLREARADVLAAKNAVAQAQLQLERTRISLPQDVFVLARDRSVNELVRRGERIGRVASAVNAQVTLQIDSKQLKYLHPRSDTAPGNQVNIQYRGINYQGHVSRSLQQLSEKTRQAQALVDIDDPFNLRPEHTGRMPLLIGSYVEARIRAGHLPNSVEIPRARFLDGHRVWVVDDQQQLQIRAVQPLFEEPGRVFIAPLPAGDRLLKGNPAGLLPGTKVRIDSA